MTGKAKKVTRAQVAAAIERESARLLEIAREAGDERGTQPIAGGWSVKDVIAHCVYWQQMLARLMGVPIPPASWIPRWQSEDQVGADELNRLTVEHYRRSTLDEVISDFRFTADQVRGVVDGMKEENLMLPAGDPWGDDALVWQAIASETHDHWKEHADALEAALKPGS